MTTTIRMATDKEYDAAVICARAAADALGMLVSVDHHCALAYVVMGAAKMFRDSGEQIDPKLSAELFRALGDLIEANPPTPDPTAKRVVDALNAIALIQIGEHPQ